MRMWAYALLFRRLNLMLECPRCFLLSSELAAWVQLRFRLLRFHSNGLQPLPGRGVRLAASAQGILPDPQARMQHDAPCSWTPVSYVACLLPVSSSRFVMNFKCFEPLSQIILTRFFYAIRVADVGLICTGLRGCVGDGRLVLVSGRFPWGWAEPDRGGFEGGMQNST